MEKLGKALTWEEVAKEYNKINSGRPAMTLPMDKVFDALSKKDNFYEDPEKGTIHKILEK